jgi:hypothetical protein
MSIETVAVLAYITKAHGGREGKHPRIRKAGLDGKFMSRVICFLLSNSPASEFYMPTFLNTLFHFHRQI